MDKGRLKMRNDINKVIMAKLESGLFRDNCNSVLRRGNISDRVEMQKNEKSVYETVIRKASRDTVRKQVTGAPIQQA